MNKLNLSETSGRRKEAVAKVSISKGEGQILINNKSIVDFFQNDSSRIKLATESLEILKKIQTDLVLQKTNSTSIQAVIDSSSENNETNNSNFWFSNLNAFIQVQGGGYVGKANAIRFALARSICTINWNNYNSNLILEQSSSLNIENTINEQLNNLAVENSSNQINLNAEIKKLLKKKGLLTQDSRVKERRKYGLKKARKASQYHKR